MNWIKSILHRPFFIRLFNWEYWSFNAIYGWVIPFWLYLSARSRSFFFFAASNPSIKNGGYLGESKKEMHEIIPVDLYPKTIHFGLPANARYVVDELSRNNFSYPLIGKPDVGGRGRGVKVLKSDEDVFAYVKNCYVDFHIQEYVPYKNEVGIFYCRYPDDESGKITGIVRKEFLSVAGNGKSTIRELLRYDRRAIMYFSQIESLHGSDLDSVLPEGERKILIPYGNHARGSKFIDDSHLIDQELTDSIDKLSKRVNNFYYGRFDIRFKDWESLKRGKYFTIIELNGAGAEPTHIYDPRHSLFFAWREIIRHWTMLWRVSRINKKRGYRYLTNKEGLAMFREEKEHSKKLAAMADQL